MYVGCTAENNALLYGPFIQVTGTHYPYM